MGAEGSDDDWDDAGLHIPQPHYLQLQILILLYLLFFLFADISVLWHCYIDNEGFLVLLVDDDDVGSAGCYSAVGADFEVP